MSHHRLPNTNGQRVKLTEKAIECGLDHDPTGKPLATVGAFIRYERDGRYMRVLRDGDRKSRIYDPSFWELDEEQQ